MRVVAHCPPTYRPEREYVLDVVLSDLLGLDYRIVPHDAVDVELAVDGDQRDRILVVPDVLFRTPPVDWLTARALPRAPLALRDTAGELPELPWAPPLPVLFGTGGASGPLTEPVARGLRLSVDIFGSVFHLLTRYEELVVRARDEHGRFPLSASLAKQAGFVQRPLVNEYAAVLQAVMARLWPTLPRPARRARVLLTHDVDVPFSVRRRTPGQNVRTIAGDVLKRVEPGLAARRLRAALVRRAGIPVADPAYTFDFIMSTSERCGIQSSFYFLTEPGGRRPGRYTLDEPWARKLLRSIAGRGHRIGLHVSYDAHLSAEATRREFQRLRAAAAAEGIVQDEWGGRQHWLRWENPVTWRCWDRAGIDYDATVGFEEEPGFRCGVCGPFPVFDLEAGRRLRLVERPLHFMETTLFDRGVDAATAAASAVRLYETCKRYGGEFVLLWHNDSLASRHRRAAYAELLRQLA
jgi:hypothetical protein